MSKSPVQAFVLPLCIAAAFLSAFYFGNHERNYKDSTQYKAYAVNLITHGLYSIDGTNFDLTREPGYPIFISTVYAVAGMENVDAVATVQATLTGMLGFLFYLFFLPHFGRRGAIATGVAISGFPLFGFYATDMLTESLFIFLIGLVFLAGAKIIESRGNLPYYWYAIFGFLCAIAALERVTFLFFFPLIAVVGLVYFRKDLGTLWPKFAAALAVFILVVGGWMTYAHAYTGKFTITEGRQETTLHVRAERTKLGYAQLTRYAVAWIERSVRHGHYDPFLDSYEWKVLTNQYLSIATTSDAVLMTRNQDIQTILSHPAHYVYGNLIEVMKLLYIEHDYTDSQSRYFRPVLFALVYGFALFGLIELIRAKKNLVLRELGFLALLFIVYNTLIVTLFDAIPRYNTPFLLFFISIACIGFALYRTRPEAKR